MRTFVCWALTLASFVIATPTIAGEPGWNVGLAEVKVTPAKPVVMSGYGGRTKPYEKVFADLYVKAMVLEDAKGQRGVIVTSDLLGFPKAIAEPICERIGAKTGLKREQILLNSSHTHAGPLLRLEAEGNDKSGDAATTVEYTKKLVDKVVNVVTLANSKLEPVKLSHGTGVIHFAMNRREFTPDRIILGVNPRGLADRSVPVLRVDTPDGKLRAVLFGAATHGTTLGADNYLICGDYAGFAQSTLQDAHPGVQMMFMLGCAGDSNPYPRGTMELTIAHGKTLAAEVEQVLKKKLRPINGPLSFAFERAELPLDTTLTKADLQKISADKRHPKKFAADQMLALLNKDQKTPTHYAAPLAVWQFGNDFTLVGLSGEVVVDYVTFLEKELGPNNLWIAGYCNDVFGYLPSARVLSEGGYETRGLYAGSVGLFAPSAESVVVGHVRELAKKAGRKQEVGR